MKVLLTNNARRFAGKATWRKGKGKRYKTRCEATETARAYLDFCLEVIETFKLFNCNGR